MKESLKLWWEIPFEEGFGPQLLPEGSDWVKNFKNFIFHSKLLICWVTEKSVVRLPFYKKSWIYVAQSPYPFLGRLGQKLCRSSYLYCQPLYQISRKSNKSCTLNRIRKKSSTYIHTYFMCMWTFLILVLGIVNVHTFCPPPPSSLGNFLENLTGFNSDFPKSSKSPQNEQLL